MNKIYTEVKTAIIYGANSIGANVHDHLNEDGINVVAFIDNLKKGSYLQKPIIKPEDLDKYKSDGYFISVRSLDLLLLFIKDLRKYAHEESIYVSLNMHLLLNFKNNVEKYLYLYEENDFLNNYIKNFYKYFNDYKYFISLNKIDNIYKKILAKTINSNYLVKKLSFKMPLKNIYSYPKINFDVNEGDIVLDCGANSSKSGYENCTYFASRCGHKGKVYAFEPVFEIYKELLEDIKDYANIIPINKGVSNENKIAYFENFAGGSRAKENGNIKVVLLKIDDFIEELNVPEVNFIKMDIEGEEVNALKGAEKTIRKFKPKLAICVYHKPEHFHEVPLYIKAIVPEYKMWVLNNELPIDGNIDGWVGTTIFCKA